MSIRIVERLLIIAGLATILFAVGACDPEEVVVNDDGTSQAESDTSPQRGAENRTANTGFFNFVAGVAKAAEEAAAEICSAAYEACSVYTNTNAPENVSCGSVSSTPADNPDLEQTMVLCDGSENFIYECSERACDFPHPVPGKPEDTAVCDDGACGVAAYSNEAGGGFQSYDFAQNEFLNNVPTPGCGPTGVDLVGDKLHTSCGESDEVWTYQFNQATGTIGERTSVIPTCESPSSLDIAPNGLIGVTTCTAGVGVLDLVTGETPMVLPCGECFDAQITDDSTCAYAVGENVNGFNLENFTRFGVRESPDGAAPTAIGRSPAGTEMTVAYDDGVVEVVDRNLNVLATTRIVDLDINVILPVANHLE
jgi:hypothetical protein